MASQFFSQLTCFHFANEVKFRVTREVIPFSTETDVHHALLSHIRCAAIVRFTSTPIDVGDAAPEMTRMTQQLLTNEDFGTRYFAQFTLISYFAPGAHSKSMGTTEAAGFTKLKPLGETLQQRR